MLVWMKSSGPDGTIDVAFGGEMDHGAAGAGRTADPAAGRSHSRHARRRRARIALQRGEVVEIAGVGEVVEIDHGSEERASRSRTKLFPMKPAPPVTSNSHDSLPCEGLRPILPCPPRRSSWATAYNTSVASGPDAHAQSPQPSSRSRRPPVPRSSRSREYSLSRPCSPCLRYSYAPRCCCWPVPDLAGAASDPRRAAALGPPADVPAGPFPGASAMTPALGTALRARPVRARCWPSRCCCSAAYACAWPSCGRPSSSARMLPGAAACGRSITSST